MSTFLGRNAPCSCGSGKKFKRCCGSSARITPANSVAEQDEPAPGWARAHAVWPKMREVLTHHSVDWLGGERLAECFGEFCSEFAVGEEDREVWFQLFHSWQLFDWIPEGETSTVADHWLGATGRRTAPHPDVRLMAASANAHALSFHQVQAVEPGKGVVLRDLLTQKERFVVDRSLSLSLPRWSVVFARLVELGPITVFDTAGPRALPPGFAGTLIAAVEDSVGHTAPFAPAEVRALGTELLDEYRAAFLEDDEQRAVAPLLRTTDDEELVLCRDEWRIEAASAPVVMQRLVALGLEREDDGSALPASFRWSRDNAGGPLPSTLLGAVRVHAATLELETNSRERRTRLKSELERALAGNLVHVRSTEREGAELFEQARREGEGAIAAELPVPPEQAREVMRELLSCHYAAWPDTELPALDGKTPRAAVATPEGRLRVEELLREFEHHSHRAQFPEAFDFDELRQELGLSAQRSKASGPP